ATSNVLSTYWGYWGLYYQNDGYVNVMLGHGNGAFDDARSTWVTTTGYSWYRTDAVGDLAVGDFNGDGKLDVAGADGAAANVDALLGNDDGTFKAVYRNYSGSRFDPVAVGNFNGDAFPDVATARYSYNDVSVFVNDTDWRTLGFSGLPAS